MRGGGGEGDDAGGGDARSRKGSPGEGEGDGLGSAGAADQGRVYVVQEGETLRTIAEREYGSREEWERIWEPNKEQIPDPNRLLAGASVLIP